jgi:hypothetical protein
MESAGSWSSNVEVYFKEGSYNGYESNSEAWSKILTIYVEGTSNGEKIDLIPETICKDTCAIFIFAATGFVRYHNTDASDEAADDGTLTIDLNGAGTVNKFGDTLTPRYWYVKLSFRLIADIPKEGVHNLPTC